MILVSSIYIVILFWLYTSIYIANNNNLCLLHSQLYSLLWSQPTDTDYSYFLEVLYIYK